MNQITDYQEFFHAQNRQLGLMNYYLTQYQFSEEILIRTLDYYDSHKCLTGQRNLTPYFCFFYLYNKPSDSTDIFTSYSDILHYFADTDITQDYLHSVYVQTAQDRKSVFGD
jgi:hypothetical protein